MKIRRNWIYTGIAVLCVAFGLKLPDLMFFYLDKGGAGEARTFTTDAVSVGAELNITDYLRLAGSQYEAYNIEKNAAASGSDAIFNSALEALSLLAEYERKAGVPEVCTMVIDSFINQVNDKNLKSQTDFGHNETPVMAAVQLENYSEKTNVRSDPGAMQEGMQDTKRKTVTAVVWECQMWDGAGNNIVMLIDDTSKKLLSFKVVWSYELTSMMNDADINMSSTLRCLTDAFARFCLEYYDLELAKIDIAIQDGDNAGTFDASESYDSETFAFLDKPADADTVADDDPTSKSSIEDATFGSIGEPAVSESAADAEKSRSGRTVTSTNAGDVEETSGGSLPEMETSAAAEGERTIETDMAQGEDSKITVWIVEDGIYAYLQYTDGAGNILKLPISFDDNYYSLNTGIGRSSRGDSGNY